MGTDRVCLDSAATSCTPDFLFFLVKEETLTSTPVASFGMAPYNDGSYYPLIAALEETEAITDKVFALLITDEGATLDIGAIVNSSMSDPVELTYLTLENPNYWSNNISQVRTRDADDNVSKTYAFDSVLAITSFDEPCIGLPQTLFN